MSKKKEGAEQPDSPPPVPAPPGAGETFVAAAAAAVPRWEGQVRNAFVSADLFVTADSAADARAVFVGWLTDGLTVKRG